MKKTISKIAFIALIGSLTASTYPMFNYLREIMLSNRFEFADTVKNNNLEGALWVLEDIYTKDELVSIKTLQELYRFLIKKNDAKHVKELLKYCPPAAIAMQQNIQSQISNKSNSIEVNDIKITEDVISKDVIFAVVYNQNIKNYYPLMQLVLDRLYEDHQKSEKHQNEDFIDYCNTIAKDVRVLSIAQEVTLGKGFKVLLLLKKHKAIDTCFRFQKNYDN